MTAIPTAHSEPFWRRITESDGHWLLPATSTGYARIKVAQRMHQAHRYVYEALVGPIPDGLQCDHLCNVRNCVNPNHLRLVTPRENTLAEHSNTPARRFAERDTCPNGHPWDSKLLAYGRRGGRACSTCIRDYQREYKRKWRARHKTVVLDGDQ